VAQPIFSSVSSSEPRKVFHTGTGFHAGWLGDCLPLAMFLRLDLEFSRKVLRRSFSRLKRFFSSGIFVLLI